MSNFFFFGKASLGFPKKKFGGGGGEKFNMAVRKYGGGTSSTFS